MVNFNLGELRGFHGRWQLGGPRHAHLRHHKLGSRAANRMVSGQAKKLGSVEKSVSRASAAKSAERTATAEAKSAGIPSSAVKGAESQLAAQRRESATILARAEHEKAMGAGGRGGEEKKAADKAAKDKKKRGGGGQLPSGALSSIANLAQIGSYLHPHRKTKAAVKKKKAPAKKKAPPKKKAAVRKAAHKVAKKKIATAHAAKIVAPKAPQGHAAKVSGAKGTGVKITPSAQVMANLAKYVATP